MLRESALVWLKRVREGQEVLKRWVQKSDPCVRAFNGKFPNSLQCEGAENIGSNFVLAVTRSYVSQLFVRNPKITVPARSPDDLLHGHIAAAVINRVVEESQVETAFQDAMRDAILRGSGWVKMGYHTESAPKFDEDVVVNSADEDVHRENEKLLINLPVEALKDEDHDKHIASHQALMDSPEIIVNLMQQFGEEADRLEQDEVGCIWEFVGDSLTPGVNYKWFQVWYGRGDAGKGTPACSRQAPITARATKTALGCACFSRS